MEVKTPRKPVFHPEDDDDLTLGEHMIAGAAAGIAEHAVMHPVDTVKTRMQTYRGVLEYRSPSMVETVGTIVRTEGGLRLWRGIGAVLLSAGPAHAVHFGFYEALKQKFSTYTSYQPLATGAAGGVATIVSEGMMAPLDVVKQRLQMSSEAHAKNVIDCIRYVYRDHGIGAFFAGYRTTLVMSVPFTAIQYTVYDAMKTFLIRFQRLSEHSFSAPSHCLAGAVAGATASAVTTPLDVVKTRLQTQGEDGARQYGNMFQALRTIHKEEGLSGLMRGIQPRMLFYAPAAAICWTTYELCKHLLGIRDQKSKAKEAVSGAF